MSWDVLAAIGLAAGGWAAFAWQAVRTGSVVRTAEAARRDAEARALAAEEARNVSDRTAELARAQVAQFRVQLGRARRRCLAGPIPVRAAVNELLEELASGLTEAGDSDPVP